MNIKKSGSNEVEQDIMSIRQKLGKLLCRNKYALNKTAEVKHSLVQTEIPGLQPYHHLFIPQNPRNSCPALYQARQYFHAYAYQQQIKCILII